MRALILLMALVGCTQQQTELHFPSEIASDWKLDGKVVETLEEAWPDARAHGLQALRVARYSGLGTPRVFAHRMATTAGAFETMQRWRAESGAAAFQYGIFFVVVRSPALGQAELTRFAGELKNGFSQEHE
jgi:hypothetical protein